MATIVHTLWLAAKRARFCCNDQALLASCPRQIPSVFNLTMHGRPRYGQLTDGKKGIP